MITKLYIVFLYPKGHLQDEYIHYFTNQDNLIDGLNNYITDEGIRIRRIISIDLIQKEINELKMYISEFNKIRVKEIKK